ncbi:hypothetical protein [Streptomyces paromomycinus]|uniref:hypothetical protein n=1 Tax=Streptomyces paromomycinus TaxID=92743 RepID=UPI001FE97C1E|nr:hypothetical protein [Streptomyces paromomycinus]
MLATHTAGQAGSVEAEPLTRLCGLSLTQVEDLLDRLLHADVLAGWHHGAEAGELRWRLSRNRLEAE